MILEVQQGAGRTGDVCGREWEETKQNRRGEPYRRLMGCGDFRST